MNGHSYLYNSHNSLIPSALYHGRKKEREKADLDMLSIIQIEIEYRYHIPYNRYTTRSHTQGGTASLRPALICRDTKSIGPMELWNY